MNNHSVTQRLSILALLLLATVLIFARSKSSSFSRNLLLINGESLEYAQFSIYSKGVLSLVTGNLETADAPHIPFRIYLQRGNVPINSGGSIPDRSVYEIDVSKVLATAKAGDFLIIEPAREEDAVPTRVIRLTDYFQPIIRLFPTHNRSGC